MVEQHMKKLLFLDIDNTLYSGKSGVVPASALQAIRQARANGSMVFLCTGRSRAEASRYLDYPVDGFIFGSGSRCEVAGKVIYDHPIDEGMVQMLAQLIRSCGKGVLMGGNEGSYVNEKCWKDVVNYFSKPDADEATKIKDMQENGMVPMKNRNLSDSIYKMGASKLHSDSFDELVKRLPKPFRLIQTLSSPEGDFGDISDGTIMKKDGIRHVVEYLGRGMEETVGIGDSGNDIDMLETCAIGIAMGNASEEVKKVADWVTTDIDEDGIYNAFAYLGVL